ncbi:MAG: ankyrin repeat domain-containing protein [Thermodesulfobacteriota bacterium]
MNPTRYCLKKVAGIISCSLFLLGTGEAASFDCRKARTKIEKLICSNDELSKLDESLSEVYLRALNRADIKQQTIESQRQWLKYERNLCQSAECVKHAYETRIKELSLSASFGLVFFRDPNRNVKQSGSLPPASAEKQIQFGAPVRAEAEASENSIPLSTEQPPREVAADSEVILISGYEPANKKAAGTVVKVEVERPGSRVLLILTSYEKVNWQVSASPSTTISGILTWAHETPTVTTSIPTQGFLVKLPYAYQTENVNFKQLLTTLKSLFGIEKLDAFRSSYAIPNHVRISSLDPFSPELTANGPPPQKPDKSFTFDLLTTSFKKAIWSLTGPLKDQDESNISEGRIAISTSGPEIYRLQRDELEICDQPEGNHAVATLPPNFPRFSWAMDVAYDSKRDIVTVVTLGGEGFLYRFDAKREEWIDFRSLNQIDIYSLSYDPSNDRYVAWTDRGSLIFISGDGNALFTRNVLPKLAGFGRLYDRNNGPVPRMTIVPHGNDIALLYIRNQSVKNIWYYNIENDTAVFTYQEVTGKEGTQKSTGPVTLPLIASPNPKTNTRADEPRFWDDWGIIGLGSVYLTSSRLRITENDITWPGCEPAPYKIISSEDKAWELFVPQWNCIGIQKESGEGHVATLTLEDEDELKITVYDARRNADKGQELAWGDFYRIPFDKERKYFGQIGNDSISMHLEVARKGDVEGTYLYDKDKKEIPLRGKIRGSNIALNVYGEGDSILEIFDGRQTDGNIKGLWKAKGKTLEFELVREPWDDHSITCEEMQKYPDRVFSAESVDLGSGTGSPNGVDYECEDGLSAQTFMKKLYDLTETVRSEGSQPCSGSIIHAHWRYYHYNLLEAGLAPDMYVQHKEKWDKLSMAYRGDPDLYQNTRRYFKLWAHQSLYNFELYTGFWKEYDHVRPILIRHYQGSFSLPLEKATVYADNALSIFLDRAAGTYPRALLFAEEEENRCDVPQKARPGITTIDEAISNQNTTMSNLEEILKQKVSQGELDQALRTALLYQKPQRILELLVRRGARINAGDESALFFALRKREHVEFLLERGADVNYENSFGKTALFYAIGFNDVGMVELLLDHKADVNHSYKSKEAVEGIQWDKLPFYQSYCSITHWKRTPLMHAAQHGDPALLQLLLQRGARLDAVDQQGFNAADYARMGDKPENLDYLRSLGLKESMSGKL